MGMNSEEIKAFASIVREMPEDEFQHLMTDDSAKQANKKLIKMTVSRLN